MTTVAKKGRGFAGMTPEKQKEIASKGGKKAHEKGTAHKWNSEEARAAGKLGGKARMKTQQEEAEPKGKLVNEAF